MALWLVRAGIRGEHEAKFLKESKLYLCWSGLGADLSCVPDRPALRALLQSTYPNAKAGRIIQNSGQIWAFVKKISPGDLVVMPSKFSPAIHVAQVMGAYAFHADGPDPYYHSLDVKWIAMDVPRTNFDQDLLYSFGAFLTICEVHRNDAERRVREMAQNGWRSAVRSIAHVDRPAATTHEHSDAESDDGMVDFDTPVDVEQEARDQIARLIIARHKGHGLARLVGQILTAQGYTVYQPPEGPDRGIDLLAAPGPLGFGEPRIVVQVKSQDTPVDRPTLDQLLGTMSNLQADRGLYGS